MKKLISALTLKQAYKDGIKEINADPANTLITPEARTLAKQLNIQLREASTTVKKIPAGDDQVKVDEAAVRDIVTRVMDKLPVEKRDAEKVKQVVVDVLSKYMKQV